MARRGRKPGCAKTPGSGRKRGARNRASVAREAEIKASGLDPLSYMLKIMRDPNETPARQLDAAKSAAPYVHPRHSTTNMDLNVNPLDHLTEEQLQQKLRQAVADAKRLNIIDDNGDLVELNAPKSTNVH